MNLMVSSVEEVTGKRADMSRAVNAHHNFCQWSPQCCLCEWAHRKNGLRVTSMNIDSGCFTFCQIQGARNAASLTTELAPSRTCGCGGLFLRAIAPTRVQPRRRTFGSREKVPPVLVRSSMVSFQAAWALQPRTSGFKRLTRQLQFC